MIPSVNCGYHGTKNILPDSFKKIDNTDTLKKAIKTWKPSDCPCRKCVGFMFKALFFSDISLIITAKDI